MKIAWDYLKLAHGTGTRNSGFCLSNLLTGTRRCAPFRNAGYATGPWPNIYGPASGNNLTPPLMLERSFNSFLTDISVINYYVVFKIISLSIVAIDQVVAITWDYVFLLI